MKSRLIQRIKRLSLFSHRVANLRKPLHLMAMNFARTFAPLGVILAACLAYANCFPGVFLFDDNIRIVEEPRIRRLWPVASLLSGERPVVDLSLAVNYALGGLNPWGYHAFNLAVHILAGLTLLGIIRRTMTLYFANREPQNIDNRLSPIDNSFVSLIAFAIALIFVVHPLQTQSVTYIIQRGESMMGLFYLLTLYCAIRAIDAARQWSWHFLAVIFCGLGMATKAVMVTAPMMVLAYDWVFLSLAANSAANFKTLRSRIPLHIGLCATWAVLWVCGIAPEVLGQKQGASHVGFSYQGMTAWEYAVSQPSIIIKYLQLAFWPASLCLDYDWPVATDWQQVVAPAVIIILMLVLTGILLWRRCWLGFLGAWFFVILAPTSSIIPIKDLMFEHRMYLPLVALIAIVIVPLAFWTTHGIVDWKSAIRNQIDIRQLMIPTWRRKLLFGLVILVLSTPLAYATHLRNRVYHSELTMWQDVATKRPNNARAYVGIGSELIKIKDWEQALSALRKAVALKNAYSDAHYNLAIALAGMGLYAEAANEYLTAARLNPTRTDAPIHAAQSLEKLGDHARAAAVMREAIHLHPTEAQFYFQLGYALASGGDFEAAKAQFKLCLQHDPEHTPARINLGNFFLRENQLEEARQQYERALAREPDNATAWLNLGRTWLQEERWNRALENFRRVPDSDPLGAEARFGEGWALAQMGRLDEAKLLYLQTLKLDPHHADAAAELDRLARLSQQPG